MMILLCSVIFWATLVLSRIQQTPLLPLNTQFSSLKFDEAIISFMKKRSITGLSVALTYDDRLVYASGFGYADKVAKIRVKTTDRFRLASVSKTVTAIGIMHLVELGELDLSDRVFGDDSVLGHAYGTKKFSKREKQITVQHLLEHSLGFVDEDMCGKGCDPTYLDGFLALDQWDLVSALLDGYSPSHTPGTFASYSNFGYFIAGRVIEAASGVTPYEQYIKDEILMPMGITNMTLATDVKQENEVVYYDPGDPDGPWKFHVNRRDSVGAWIATPIDLVTILTSINGLPGRPNFLNQSMIDLMFEVSPVKNSSFAKGWDVVREAVGEDGDVELLDAGKSGGYSGTRSWVNINFRNKTTYAIVVNYEMEKGMDLRELMNNLTFPITDWPDLDLFENGKSEENTLNLNVRC